MASPLDLLRELTAQIKKRQAQPGPVKWCKQCSRTHARRTPCDLYLRTRMAKSGRRVKRWCH